MDPPQSSTLQACKLVSACCLLCLVFIPSLLLSLIFFSFFAFLLFLPTVCILVSLYLLSAIISRIRVTSLRRLVLKVSASGAGAQSVDGSAPDCIDVDCSEVPPFDESSEEGEQTKEFPGEDSQENREDILQFQDQIPMESGEYYWSFYEVLSFGKSKEGVRA